MNKQEEERELCVRKNYAGGNERQSTDRWTEKTPWAADEASDHIVGSTLQIKKKKKSWKHQKQMFYKLEHFETQCRIMTALTF